MLPTLVRQNTDVGGAFVGASLQGAHPRSMRLEARFSLSIRSCEAAHTSLLHILKIQPSTVRCNPRCSPRVQSHRRRTSPLPWKCLPTNRARSNPLSPFSNSSVKSKSPAPRNATRWLLGLFVLSLALINPWVRGDGVGYYAFARAVLIQHNLDFTPDYNAANASFRDARLDENGNPKPVFHTATNHLENHFTVGPAILWAPFLIVAHVGVLVARALGSSVAADGFSAPYRFAMALGTAVYGFLGLLLAMRIAAKYAGERWAFLATLAIWWASSLPVYMYFNPSWSHAHSAFVVALFLWYWHETRETRSTTQWIVLAAIAGLMLNVYYPNAMVLAVLLVEAVAAIFRGFSRVAIVES